MWFAPLAPAMTKKRSRTRRSKTSEEALQGPPPREATILRSDAERHAEAEVDRRDTNPRLSAGDVDADWQRAHDVGEEAPGGSVATPDQDQVDEIGDALGVHRGPDEEVKSSSEILDERDRRRWDMEQP
jgi:hypothetical protein